MEFGCLIEYRKDMVMVTIDQIARVAHEVNRVYCEIVLGDFNQPHWNEASEHQRASVIGGVMFALSTPDVTPEASHQAWIRCKRADGWCYGLEKSPQLKQHPCMLPFNELPREDQVKDRLFLAIVDTLTRLNTEVSMDWQQQVDAYMGEANNRG